MASPIKTSGDGEGKGGLVCYSPWGCKESDVTRQLNNNDNAEVIELELTLTLVL